MFANECPESEELSVDAVEDRLEEVPLAGILAVEELQELEDEFLVDDFLPDARLEVGGLQEPQEELVD